MCTTCRSLFYNITSHKKLSQSTMFMDNTHIHKPTTIYKDMTEIVAHSMFFFNSLAKESFSCMAYTWGICYNLIVS